MQTTTIQHTRGTPSIPARMPTPPPATKHDPRDTETTNGSPDGAITSGAPSRTDATHATPATLRDDWPGILGTLLIIAVMLAVIILPAMTTATVVLLLGGVAGLVALAALGSLVHLAVTDVRDTIRRGRRSGAGAPLNRRRVPTAAQAAGT